MGFIYYSYYFLREIQRNCFFYPTRGNKFFKIVYEKFRGILLNWYRVQTGTLGKPGCALLCKRKSRTTQIKLSFSKVCFLKILQIPLKMQCYAGFLSESYSQIVHSQLFLFFFCFFFIHFWFSRDDPTTFFGKLNQNNFQLFLFYFFFCLCECVYFCQFVDVLIIRCTLQQILMKKVFLKEAYIFFT